MWHPQFFRKIETRLAYSSALYPSVPLFDIIGNFHLWSSSLCRVVNGCLIYTSISQYFALESNNARALSLSPSQIVLNF